MAVINAFAQDAVDRAEPLTVAAACAQCRAAGLAESVIGAVGLEIESHLVDLDHVAVPVPWKRVEAIAAVVGKVAPGSAVTVEPGGHDHLLDDTGDHGGRLAPASGRAVGSPVRSCHWSASTGKNYQGEQPAQIIHYGAARASWPDTFIAAQIGGN